eukprot:3310139-Rhodomonas_salina.2
MSYNCTSIGTTCSTTSTSRVLGLGQLSSTVPCRTVVHSRIIVVGPLVGAPTGVCRKIYLIRMRWAFQNPYQVARCIMIAVVGMVLRRYFYRAVQVILRLWKLFLGS